MAGEVLLVFVFIIGVLELFAVISNVFVILSVMFYKKLRTVTNVLISNLAVSDLLLGGLYMPKKLHDITHAADYFDGATLCKLINFTPIFLITSSCYTLVCISFERRRAIVTSHKTQLTLTHICKVIPAIWVFSFVVPLPILFEYTLDVSHEIDAENRTFDHIFCGHSNTSYTYVLADGILVLITSFLIPLILIFSNYFVVVRFINRRGRTVLAEAKPVPTISGGISKQSGSPVTNKQATSGEINEPSPPSDINKQSPPSEINKQLPPSEIYKQSPLSEINKQSPLNEINKQVPPREPNKRSASYLQRNRLKVIKMLVLVAGMFALSWVPFFGLYMYMKITGKDASKDAGSAAGLLLISMTTFSTAYNSILYVVFNRNFRKAFRSILKRSFKELLASISNAP